MNICCKLIIASFFAVFISIDANDNENNVIQIVNFTLETNGTVDPRDGQFAVYEGSDVQFECVVDSVHPTNITVHSLSPAGQPIRSGLDQTIGNRTTAKFIRRNIFCNETYRYICTAAAAPSQTVNKTMGVTVYCKPKLKKKVVRCTSNPWNATLEIIFEAFPTINQTAFLVDGLEIDRNRVIDNSRMGSYDPSKTGFYNVALYLVKFVFYLDLSDLKLDHNLSLRVTNAIGRSDYVISTAHRGKSGLCVGDGDEGFDPTIIIIVGVMAAVIIIAIAVAVVIFLRNTGTICREPHTDQHEKDTETNGRTINNEGLVYVTVAHANAPKGQDRSQDAKGKRADKPQQPQPQPQPSRDGVEYVTLDLHKTKTLEGRDDPDDKNQA